MQFRCKHARIEFDPDYREHCVKIGTPQCNGCKLVELRPAIKVSYEQMERDEKYATRAYDYTSEKGEMVITW